MQEKDSRNTENTLTREDVSKVASLGMLEFGDQELDTFTAQLQSILDLAEQFEAFDLDELPPTAHPFGLQNVYRVDEVDEVSVSASVLSIAPSVEDNQFRVPPSIGEEQ